MSARSRRAPFVRRGHTMTTTEIYRQDVTRYVTEALDYWTNEFDVAGIVDALIRDHGYTREHPEDVFWATVARHDLAAA